MQQAENYCLVIEKTLREQNKSVNIESYVISTRIEGNLRFKLYKNKSEDKIKYNTYCYAYTWQDIIQKIKDGLSKQSRNIFSQIQSDDAYKCLQEKYKEYW